MKNLKDIIQERLHITKDTGKNTFNINISKSVFTADEIDSVIEFANLLNIKPYIIANKFLKRNEIIDDYDTLYLYFYEDYLKIETYKKFDETQYSPDRNIILVIKFKKYSSHDFTFDLMDAKHGWLYPSIPDGKLYSIDKLIDYISEILKEKYSNKYL